MLMRSLGQALLGRPENTDGIDVMEFDMEKELERQIESQLDQDCMAEIDRYRRMDEWTSSFHNIYSRTAISCQRRLMKAGILEYDPVQFIHYTRAGTFEMLRVDAFDILADFNIFERREILAWFIYVMSADPSPYIRRHMHEIFGINLAMIAFGYETAQKKLPVGDGVVIEQENSIENRQSDLARRRTVPGALEALKTELTGNATLKDLLWAACNSFYVQLSELSDLVDICGILWDPVDRMMVTLKLPRYWVLENLGKVSFSTQNRNMNVNPLFRGSFASLRGVVIVKCQHSISSPSLRSLSLMVPLNGSEKKAKPHKLVAKSLLNCLNQHLHPPHPHHSLTQALSLNLHPQDYRN